MSLRGLVVLTSIALAGCYTWSHSPGYDSRSTMVKQQLGVQTWKLCHRGACDKRGPAGPIQFTNVRYMSRNGARETTSFDVAYQGARASCRSGQREDPFECAIADSRGGTHRLALTAGCTAGSLTGASGMAIQTDSVAMAGRQFPAREVSLVDAAGVLAYSSAHADDNLVLYTRRGAALQPPVLVAMVAVQAFLQLDDLPAACVTST